jgi:hypothetical protein
MTTRLSCRDVERLIIAGEDVEDHLRGCGRCRAFAADRNVIRDEIAAVRWPAPPDGLVRRTRRLLVEPRRDASPAPLPAWVLVAMAVTAIVTGLWLTFSLADVRPEMTLADLPIAGLAAVFVIIQNALMLFFAPVLLRTFRARRSASESAQ